MFTQILNKKDILTDFCVHLLLLGDEFHNDELHFFDSREKNDANYENYVGAINKLINVEDFIWNTDVDKPISKIETLNDLISKKEIEFFQEHINIEFRFGYPNEINEDGLAWGVTYNLNLSVEDIESYFVDYINLRKLAPNQYITYYQQFIDFLYHQSNKATETTKNEIDNFHKNKICTPTDTYLKLKNRFKTELEDVFLKNFKLTSFQIQGGFDEFGFIFNYDKSLKAVLESHNSNNPKLNLELDPKNYFALVNYEYLLFKTEDKQTSTITKEQKLLDQGFEAFKDENYKQVKFLRNKGFSSREINIVLNCFSLNEYNPTNVRYIRNLKGVRLFIVFYFFYRFDYLEQIDNIKFDTQKDYNKLPLTNKDVNLDCNQFKKYYDRVENQINEYNPEKHYPFFSIENTRKLLDTIKNDLHIDLGKLNIPKPLKDFFKKA